MTTYYVDGANGNDANAGTSWALAKKTLNGAEDIPVVANDTVYVGPGVYREKLVCDVSGSAGNPITYIGDVSGSNTDGIGGIVRITGSDDDQSATRNQTIGVVSKNYRTFRGFAHDMSTGILIYLGGATNAIIEDNYFGYSGSIPVYADGSGQADHTVRRCVFAGVQGNNSAIIFTHSSTVDDAGHLIENCLIMGPGFHGVQLTRVGGNTIKNCSIIDCGVDGVKVTAALSGGQTITIENNIFAGIKSSALTAQVLGEIVEDYNTFFANVTDRANVAVGANSQTHPPLFEPPIFLDGFKYPPPFLGQLSEWSEVATIAGNSEATDDLSGFTRPVTSAKKSWGCTQFVDSERDTTTARTGTASIVLNDAGRVQMFVPVSNISTTISVYVNREGGYTGSNPQMIIKQPGQADRTTTDAGADSTWNQLTDTFTPAANPPYVIVELVSRNTASAGLYANFAVYFDDLDVS